MKWGGLPVVFGSALLHTVFRSAHSLVWHWSASVLRWQFFCGHLRRGQITLTQLDAAKRILPHTIQKQKFSLLLNFHLGRFHTYSSICVIWGVKLQHCCICHLGWFAFTLHFVKRTKHCKHMSRDRNSRLFIGPNIWNSPTLLVSEIMAQHQIYNVLGFLVLV